MRILIVEDEPGIYNFLKQGLEEEAFAVDVSDNGKQGLALALSGNYDLLLLDWMLPGMSGIELTRQFRKEFEHTPIIFLTAKDTVDETIFGLQSGANDHIKKPFHFEEENFFRTFNWMYSEEQIPVLRQRFIPGFRLD